MTRIGVRDEGIWIARTELTCETSHGAKSLLTVEISAPLLDTGSGISRCRFRISGLRQGALENEIQGADSFQALALCVQRVGVELALVRRHQRLTWANTDDDDLGFPVDIYERDARPRRTAYLPQPDSALRKSIREGFAMLRRDPVQAGKVLGRLRKQCLRREFVDSAMMCLQGELAAARTTRNTGEELRLTRILARQQPSAENLVAAASCLMSQGKQRGARTYLLQASAVAAHGTKLHRSITAQLEALCKQRSKTTAAGKATGEPRKGRQR